VVRIIVTDQLTPAMPALTVVLWTRHYTPNGSRKRFSFTLFLNIGLDLNNFLRLKQFFMFARFKKKTPQKRSPLTTFCSLC
jgi:hypothetical protein